MKSFASNLKHPDHRSEKRLMTLLNRVSHLDREAIGSLLSKDLDWDYIFRIADSLHAAPLFSYNLREWEDREPVASELVPFLQEAYHETLARNMHLLHEFDAVVEDLTGKGIAVIPLKGAALARDLYPSIALRPMYDIDLLVKKEDVAGVDEVLRRTRYRAASSPTAGKGFTYDRRYIKETKAPAVIEIHWNLGEENRYRLDIAGIWDRAVPASKGPGLKMSGEDTLLYLALHFFKHYLFKRLIWLCDIHEWTQQKEIDWSLVLDRARSQSITTFLAYTLKIYEDFYGVRLPLRFEEAALIGPLRKRVLDGYLHRYPLFHPLADESYLRQRVFAFTCIDRMSDRLRFTMDALRRDRERRSA